MEDKRTDRWLFLIAIFMATSATVFTVLIYLKLDDSAAYPKHTWKVRWIDPGTGAEHELVTNMMRGENRSEMIQEARYFKSLVKSDG